MIQKRIASLTLLLVALGLAGVSLHAQPSTFTYQGHLNASGAPVTGRQDFEFRLFSAETGGVQVGAVVALDDVGVTNGLFTVMLDFGYESFTGPSRWLEIAVRPGADVGVFTTLTPRQAITSAPHAVRANASGVATLAQMVTAGGVNTSALADLSVTGAKLTDGAVNSAKVADGSLMATDVNATTFDTTFWRATGNAGTTPGTHFLGTTDNQALELRANGETGLRVIPNFPGVAPSLVGGWKDNLVTAGQAGSVIAGGGSSAYTNHIAASFATVGGGAGNRIGDNANQSVVAGGFNNQVQSGAYSSTIAGGDNNRIATNAFSSAILGGSLNTVADSANYSVVVGGRWNTAGAPYSLAGGRQARALHEGSFVWADSMDTDFVSADRNQFLIRASGGVGINTNNPHGAALAIHGDLTFDGTISGPSGGLVTSVNGMRNDVTFTAGNGLTLSGNQFSLASSGTTITDTVDNQFGLKAVVPPGTLTGKVGLWGVGGETTATTLNAPAGVQGEARAGVGVFGVSRAPETYFAGVRGQGLGATTGVYGHSESGYGVYGRAGGSGSALYGESAAPSAYAGDFMGNVRVIGQVGVGTGSPQASLHLYSANNPTVMRLQSSGGFGAARIEFVSDPQASGSEWRPGYIQSTDNGGFAGGLAFVVNGTGFDNRFGEVETMRVVNGRVGIGTTTPVSALQVVGTVTATAFNPPSDRNLKENFQPVSPRDVLEKVAAMPISRWNFKDDDTTPHLGPMAQDFHAAFGLGTDDKHIATVDADGVALAAVQGLNQKVEAQNAALRAENAALLERVARLEALLPKPANP